MLAWLLATHLSAYWLFSTKAHRYMPAQVLRDSLSNQTEAPAALPEPSPKFQHWRERAYVMGFLADAHVAAWRLLAELTHSAGMFKLAETHYSKVITTLEAARSSSNRAELPLAEALWGAARMYRCSALNPGSCTRTNEHLFSPVLNLPPSQ
jgi:hypothetical protein